MGPWDREHLQEILLGHGDWFTARLIRLIARADPARKERLRLGFPEEVAAVEEWQRNDLGGTDGH